MPAKGCFKRFGVKTYGIYQKVYAFSEKAVGRQGRARERQTADICTRKRATDSLFRLFYKKTA
jgi:hypothetical protein